jgi:hypothetical protein
MDVRWEPIPGYEGRYMVSDSGDVWSIPRRNASGGFLKQVLRKGYARVSLYKPTQKKPKVMQVHRIVLISFVSPCPDGMECRHLDGNPLNNNLSNLAWGTKLENEADKLLCGNRLSGEKNPRAKLRSDQISEIIRLNGSATQRELGKMFNVHPSTIYKIHNRIRWIDRSLDLNTIENG